jgi:cyclically-permuted mutarotase family protein
MGFLLFFITSITLGQGKSSKSKITINALSELPARGISAKSLGYAGMIGGFSNSVMIAAGGANFPNGLPWYGGEKVWSDSIFILQNNEWKATAKHLPEPLAYSASIKTDNSIVVIGGNNSVHVSKTVYAITYDNTQSSIKIEEYPSLPYPLVNLGAVLVGNYIYVVGGNDGINSRSTFIRLDITKLSEWEILPDFPGPARSFHQVVFQQASQSDKIYAIGGRNIKKGEPAELLDTYISYDLKKEEWNEENKIEINGESRILMGGSAVSAGSMHFLIYGGSDGKIFQTLESLENQITEQSNDSIRTLLIDKKNQILNTHPGFGKEILAFNTITDKWFVYETLERKIPVTTLSFKNEDKLYMISGEVSPGIRTPAVLEFETLEGDHTFGVLNYTVLFGYLLISLFIGFYFARRQKSTGDYFLGGGRIPWWASGLSVFGTLLSALTFMAIPAKTFLTDWSYFFLNITAIIIVPVIVFLFIPYFNRLKINTAYEFLEIRFNYFARALGSLSFILFQLGRIAIVLLLPSLAISIVTGISVDLCILLMGVLCIIYTTFGGIEAVIWTDVLQVIVLLGGSILAIILIFWQTEITIKEAYLFAVEQDKLNILNMDLNFVDATFWVVFLGGLASALISQGTDQTIVQRYLTSSNVKDAQKTSYTNAIMTLPATFIFFGIGTLLFIFYSKMPERISPQLSSNDSIFPWYIVNELPTGISGLLVAAVFSAAMSSISSSLNSVSTAFCNDFYKHFRPSTDDMNLLKIARYTTMVIGILGVILALWMAHSNIKSLWDQFYKFLGLITGGLGGMFLLGIVTKKANSKGTLLGVLISTITVWYLSIFSDVNFLMYSFIGLFSCVLFGYFFSLIFKNSSKKIE